VLKEVFSNPYLVEQKAFSKIQAFIFIQCHLDMYKKKDLDFFSSAFFWTREKTENFFKLVEKESLLKSKKEVGDTKKKYLDYVFLTDEQFFNLKNKFGHDKTMKMIEVLDNYLPNSQRKKPYKCHYRALLGWVSDRVFQEDQQKNKFNQPKTDKFNFVLSQLKS